MNAEAVLLLYLFVNGFILFCEANIYRAAGGGYLKSLFAFRLAVQIAGTGCCVCNDTEIIFVSDDGSAHAAAVGIYLYAASGI